MTDPAARIYDRILVLRCQAGDAAALTELIARYSPGLRFFLAKLTGQESLADDLLQDTWFDAYRKIAALRQPHAFAAWLYRIARDKACRQMRRKEIAPPPAAVHEQHLDPPGEEPSFSPDDAQSVRLALDRLAPEYREVLTLRFIEDMRYEEIAEVIRRPVGTVRSRLHYAKAALRDQLQHEFTHSQKEITP